MPDQLATLSATLVGPPGPPGRSKPGRPGPVGPQGPPGTKLCDFFYSTNAQR